MTPQQPGAVGATGPAGRGGSEAALQELDRALLAAPLDGSLLKQRALLLHALGRTTASLEACRRALAVQSGDRQLLRLLGTLLFGHGQTSEAARIAEQLVRLQPPELAALPLLSQCLQELGLAERGLPLLRQIQAGAPADLAIGSQLLMTLQLLPRMEESERQEAALHWGQRANAEAARWLDRRPQRPAAAVVDPRPLRVGYLSPDLHRHQVGLVLWPVLEAHDPLEVTPFLYDHGPRSDEITAALAAAVRARGGEHVRVAHLENHQLAERIRADRIDLLVDLAGHRPGSRLAVLAARPAPVQLSWLGYFAGTGLSAIDAVILDAHQAPAAEGAPGFTEAILRLPHSRFCYRPMPFAPPLAPGPMQRQEPVSFGCFHNTSKLNREVLGCWAELLRRLPQSRLILKARSLADPLLSRDIRTFFSDAGLESQDRLELRPLSSHAELLAQYADVDIALDPWPVSGAYTTFEALWMGVPVLTLAGERVISRQTQALLTVLDLHQELVANSPNDYVDRAVDLAQNPDRLRLWRHELRQRLQTSPLMDHAAFCRDLEALYRQAWLRFAVGSRRVTATPVPSEKVTSEPSGGGTDRSSLAQAEAPVPGPVPDGASDPVFVVMAPPFRANSAGIWLLHALVHTLNGLGIPAYLELTRPASEATNPRFVTPLATGLGERLRQRAIVVYPDVITNNPLGSERVVRYLLYFAGAKGTPIQFGENDFILSYARMFRPNANAFLYHPISSPEIFHARGTRHACERSLDLFYVGKGSIYGPCSPIPGAIELGSGWPARKSELAELLRHCRYLFSYDTVTSVCSDAALCGAIPWLLGDRPISRHQLREEPIAAPFVLDACAAELADYAQRQADFRAMVERSSHDFPQRLAEVVRQISAHFNLTPAIG